MARKRAHRRAVLPMAVDIFAIGETGCSCTCGGGGPCNATVCVTGAAGTALSGATVNILTACSGGSTVVTGTTDPTGCVTINIGSAGTYCVQVIATGFNTWTLSTALTCGGTTNVPLATANGGGGTGGGVGTGYTYCSPCNNPWPNTLHYTCGAYSHILTFVSNGWYGTDNLSHWNWVKCTGSTFCSNTNYTAGQTAFGTVTCSPLSITGSFPLGVYCAACSFTITP